MIFSLTLSSTLQYVLGGSLIFLAVLLTVVVLFQSAKDKSLSGTIAGGAETFFGKTKGTAMDKILSKVTIILSILIVLITVALGIIINCLTI